MSKMRKALSEQGWEVLDMGYPSTRRSLEEHAEQLGGLLDRLAEDGIERVDRIDAEKDVERAAKVITESYDCEAYVAVNKAVVTQASSAIPVVPLYISILFKVMKQM